MINRNRDKIRNRKNERRKGNISAGTVTKDLNDGSYAQRSKYQKRTKSASDKQKMLNKNKCQFVKKI